VSETLGTVLSLANGKLHRYGISGDTLPASSHDLIQRFPALYVFQNTKGESAEVIPQLKLRVLDEIVNQNRAWDNDNNRVIFNRELNLIAIRFAMARIADVEGGSEVDLTRQNLSQFHLIKPAGHSELRKTMLAVFAELFKFDPNETMTSSEFLPLLDSPQEDIQTALRVLSEQTWIVERRNKRPLWARVFEPSWNMNPAKVDDIDNLVLGLPKSGLLIFLSYSSLDKSLAGSVKAHLERMGKDLNLSVFLAHEDIDPSDVWIQEIKLHLANCAIFMPLFSSNFLRSHWANQEVGIAYSTKKRIIPLKAIKIPMAFCAIFKLCILMKQMLRRSAKS
jgi:hypothetical protein